MGKRSGWSGIVGADRSRQVGRAAAGAAAGALALLVLHATGAVTAADDSLGAMGFDPDRSRLIAGLTIDAIAVGAGVLPVGPSLGAIAAGAAGFVAVFGPTFAAETTTAMSGATNASFDPLGWALTATTLAVALLLVGGATAILAGRARRAVLGSFRVLGAARTTGADRRTVAGALGVLVAAALVVVALPVFGDMVNYGPDVRMVAGGPSGASLAGGPASSAPPLPSFAPLPSGGGLAGVLPAAGNGAVTSDRRPWLAWRPSGAGTLARVQLPAPWKGVAATTAAVAVYTPPGYAGETRRYPVVYEVPWGSVGFEAYVHITTQLDGLITSGAIPAEIVVFASESGGPYPDSECMNSADGREWFERYVVSTLVPYVDGHYRTIATPAARAVFGFSQGGYCAPMLLLRHPDVFRSAIAFSGYFQSGIRDSETPNAWRPYRGDQALIDATSPLLIVPRLPAAVRDSLFCELSASPHEPFFGRQYLAFAATLHDNGVPIALFPTPLGHAWAAVRQQLPKVLETLAAHEVAIGVFSG